MTNTRITYSSELMSNFKQAEVMAPEAKFEALQTERGYALLFSVGSDGIFYVTQESPEHTTGWEKTDLISALAPNHGGAALTTRTFAVAQNRATAAIDLAVVVTAADGDHLYLSRGNSSSETGWVQRPGWVRVPFDDQGHPRAKVVVANVFLSQASDGEYIVVDVLRDPDAGVPVVFRYYIDSTKASGQAWQPHDVAADLDASKFMSCLGRRKGDLVDGIYTLGSIGDHSSLVYQELYDPFASNPTTASPAVSLVLPADAAPSAIAAAAVDGEATDLYVACRHTLYYFPTHGQHDHASGVKLLDHELFADVSRLFAFSTAGKIIVWGLNRANQVFYTTCDRTMVETATAWSYPLPILENAEQISPYVNRANDGNTFFAHTGLGQLQKAVQTPATTWKFDSILLPAPRTAKATKFNSYTTRVHVTDERGTPQANANVQISAQHRASVYINGLYYVLDTTPIPVKTDATGGIAIVEWVSNLQATTVSVHGDDGTVHTINPMDTPFQKAAKLDNAESLRSAAITNQDGSTRPLIDPQTSDGDRKAAAAAIANLKRAYDALPADGTRAVPRGAATPASPGPQGVPPANVVSLGVRAGAPTAPDSLLDFGDAIVVAAGDLFSHLDTQVEYGIHVVKEEAAEIWHLVVEVAGKTYSSLLDEAAKVVGALEYIFKLIKAAIKDLLDYLKFLFDWKDIGLTGAVIKKLILLQLGLAIDQIDELKQEFNDRVAEAKKELDDWAGLRPDTWQAGGEHGDKPAGSLQSIANVTDFITGPAMFLLQHLLENMLQGHRTRDDIGAVDVAEELLNRAAQAVADEKSAMSDAANRIISELTADSQYETLSLDELVKKLTAIVADALLNTGENLVDTLLDIVVILARAAVAALDTPIWIPVVSDILEDAFGVDIPYSALDILVMAGAVPATLFFKALTDQRQAPFSLGDGFSETILGAKDVYALQAAFPQHAPTPRTRLFIETRSGALADPDPGKKASSFVPITLPERAQNIIFTVGHIVGGYGSLAAGFWSGQSVVIESIMESENGEGADALLFLKRLTITANIVSVVATTMALVLAQPYPIQNNVMSKLSTAASVATVAEKLAFMIAPSAIAKQRKITDKNELTSLSTKLGKIESGLDCILATAALAPTLYHFFELSKDTESRERSEAIVEETSNIFYNLSRYLTFAAVMVEEQRAKAALAVTASALVFTYGGLQMAEGSIEGNYLRTHPN